MLSDQSDSKITPSICCFEARTCIRFLCILIIAINAINAGECFFRCIYAVMDYTNLSERNVFSVEPQFRPKVLLLRI